MTNLHDAPCLAWWELFGSLVPEIYNRPSCTQVHELRQSYCGGNREGTLFPWLHIFYAHIALWNLSTWCVVDYLWPLLLNSLFNLLSNRWFQQCVTIPYLPKCKSCQKTTVMITRRTHCLHNLKLTDERFCKILLEQTLKIYNSTQNQFEECPTPNYL